MEMKVKICSALAKVLPAEECEYAEYDRGCALRGETFAFQVAVKAVDFYSTHISIKAESDFGDALSIRQVRLVPVGNPSVLFDDDYLVRTPQLMPDLLQPLCPEESIQAVMNQWRAFWITVKVPKDAVAGEHKISLDLHVDHWDGTIDEKVDFTLEVLAAELPEQTLVNTHWFHSDCLATYYKVPVFSEEYWRIVENFMRNANAHGINMILTPVLTPPLDTKVGAERPTVQLVDVTVNNGEYSFDFTRLERWVKLAQSCGMKYFEISHIFTQWGAECCPKVVATVDGVEKRIFGWDTKADSKEYGEFLAQFLPRLITWFEERGLKDKMYFHCSDEPTQKNQESFRKAVEVMRPLVGDCKVMDALSDVSFFEQGLITMPVPCESKAQQFIDAGMSPRWCYYCCGPSDVYSNRHIAMPSSRNRIMGTLLYRHAIEGFLHWGFNFYFSQYSRYPINPYCTVDSDGAFPGGDPFLVYPGEGGVPEDSIRHEVFTMGLQDMRVMQYLESRIGREALEAKLDSLVDGERMTMSVYPKGEKNFLTLRKMLDDLVRENCG